MLRRRNRTVNPATDPSYPRITMTVLELINLLKTMPPQAEVVVPVYQDRADEYCVRSLDASQVQVIQMRKAPEIKGILKPARTPCLYLLEQEGGLAGVVIGYDRDDGPLSQRQINNLNHPLQ